MVRLKKTGGMILLLVAALTWVLIQTDPEVGRLSPTYGSFLRVLWGNRLADRTIASWNASAVAASSGELQGNGTGKTGVRAQDDIRNGGATTEPSVGGNGTASGQGLPTPEPSISTRPTLPPGTTIETREWLSEGDTQRVHVMTVDLAKAELRFLTPNPGLFGFSSLKDLMGKSNALAGVNAGFCQPTGRPAGMVMLSGTLWCPATGRYPILAWGGAQAVLMEAKEDMKLERLTQKTGKVDATLPVEGMNLYPRQPGITVYTPVFGSTDRVARKHLSVIVSGGRIEMVREFGDATPIPADGYVISAFGVNAEKHLRAWASPLREVRFISKTIPSLPDGAVNAVECGAWLVHDGKNVAPATDAWVGTLENHTPRTAVGIRDNGSVVFVVVDGRQPGYSSGVTGRMLGEMLMGLGLRDAAMLDGGGSSEMRWGDAVWNRPSSGEGRLLSSGFGVFPR